MSARGASVDAPGARPWGAGALRSGRLAAVVAAASLLVLAWLAWRGVLGIELSGEDAAIFARLAAGERAYPHVFRPLSGALLAGMHAAFDGSAAGAPHHAVSLLLHALNACLVAAIGARLTRSPLLGWAAGAVFVAGAAATDAVTWVAALNRPLSAAFGLTAMLGLARLCTADPRKRGAALLVALGLAGQLLSNEEGYGTALLVGLCGLALAVRAPEQRRTALGLAALALALVAAHYLGPGRVPRGAEHVVSSGLARLGASVVTRAGQVVAGWGLPAALGLVLPLGLAAAALLRAPRAAPLLALGAWVTAFVPFALSDATPYRAYPSLAPTAWLAVLGVAALARRVPHPALAGLLALAAFAGAHRPRAARLALWEARTAELGACRAALQGFPRGAAPPALINLESTTAALFLEPWSVDTVALRRAGFLDAATGYVPLREAWPGPWFGRRWDGSLGALDGATYFAGRRPLPAVATFTRARVVDDLEAARALLASPELDVTRELVVEVDAALRARLPDVDAPLEPAEVLVPFAYDPATRIATLRVRTARAGASLLAVLENILFHPDLRISPDQMLFSGVEKRRVVELTATDRASGARLPTFRADAFGVGVLVPAGEHELDLVFTIAKPASLR